MSIYYETYFVGTTNLADYGTIEAWDGALAKPGRRGSDYVLPGANGAVWTSKPLDVFTVTIPMVLHAGTVGTGVESTSAQTRLAQLQANWDALWAICDSSSGPVTLKKRVSLVAGSYSDKTCNARLAGAIAPTMLGANGARCILEFVNLDGAWT